MEKLETIFNRILVVDDDIETLDILKRLLEKSGYDVTTCLNGYEAYAALRENTFPVVLADIQMPGKTGQELIRDVLDMVKGTQIVLMTAYSSIDKVLDAYQEGASDYLLKPFSDMDEVLSVVQRANNRFKRWFSAVKKTYAGKKASRESA